MAAFRIVKDGGRRRGADERDGAPAAAGTLDDAALVTAVRMGNPAVADAFCRRVWPQVDRTVRRLLGRNDSEREDITQMALIEIVRSVSRYRGESSLDTWVSSVTAHVVYRQLRRTPLGRHVPLDTIGEDSIASDRPTSEGTTAAREILARILVHLDAAGEKLAWGFVLHDVLGYGLREAAQIMGVSEAAAQSRLVRGRKRIHESIAADSELADLLEEVDLPPP